MEFYVGGHVQQWEAIRLMKACIYEPFCSRTDGKPHLSATQLVDFLNVVQRDPRLNEILHPYADLQRAKDLIKAYEHNKYHQQRSQLTFDGFLRYFVEHLIIY